MSGYSIQSSRQAIVINQQALDDDQVATRLALFDEDGNPLALGATDSTVVARALGWEIADDYGLDTTGATTHTAAEVQAWLDAGVAYAAGTIRCSGTVTIKNDCDLHLLTLLYTGTGTALTVGVAGSYISRRRALLPRVVNASKGANGWAAPGVAGTVGVLVQNCYSVDLTIPYVRGFETGLRIAGYSYGTSYCNVNLGHLDNNKVNLHFAANAGGWANQNQFFGGRLSHNSNEGTVVAGTRQVKMDLTANKINNNSFFGTSLESTNIVEYHLDCAGNDNYWINCRWENAGSGARVVWRADSVGNLIMHGYGAHSLVETKEAGSSNHLITRSRSRMVGNGGGTFNHAVLHLENTSSSARPSLRVTEAGADSGGADQTTAWAVELSANKLKGKRSGDAFERAIMDHVYGRFYVGTGAEATNRYLGAFGSNMCFEGSSVLFATHNTYDLGSAAQAPRFVFAGTAIRPPAVTTANRPAPSVAGSGGMVYDTTLNKPIWSTGTAWVDATGATV